MARIQTLATGRLAELLRAEDGLSATCAELQNESGTPADTEVPVLLEQFITADLAEKASTVRYPVIHVFCNRVVNQLTEKFRTFSGTASLAIEVRVTHDHATELQQVLAFYVEAVTEVLHRHRGDWGQGVFYTGGYEITFQPIKRGGKSYLQSAVITLEAHISL